MKDIIYLHNLNNKKTQAYRVYSSYGLSPTLNTNGGGGHTPIIVIKDNENEKNNKIR